MALYRHTFRCGPEHGRVRESIKELSVLDAERRSTFKSTSTGIRLSTTQIVFQSVHLQLLLSKCCKQLSTQLKRPSVQELERARRLEPSRVRHSVQKGSKLSRWVSRCRVSSTVTLKHVDLLDAASLGCARGSTGKPVDGRVDRKPR